jgi:RNA polymerase sigma-70 factor (ECF subfamily)
VKDWGPVHQTSLRLRADRLEAARPGHFTRRGREAVSPREQHMVDAAVLAAQRGDREALRFLYLRYADHVYGYVRAIVRDDHEAEDVTQLVFAKLLRVLDRYEPAGVPFSRWLLRLAHNAAIDHLRAARAVPVEEVRPVDEPGDDDAGDRLRTLRLALEAIPDDQRQVLVLRHVAGLSAPEIAERLGRTQSSVHSLHHRGRRALRAALAELGAAPVTLHRLAA